MQVFIEPIEPPPQLVILGAGHVGLQLGRLAPALGFRVTVVDDRERFANRERFPDADNVVVDSIPDWIDRTPALLRPPTSSCSPGGIGRTTMPSAPSLAASCGTSA